MIFKVPVLSDEKPVIVPAVGAVSIEASVQIDRK